MQGNPAAVEFDAPSAEEGFMAANLIDLPVLPALDARIPRWSLHALEFRTCPFCGSSNEASLLRPDGLPVAFCGDCRLWYVAGLPPLDEIQKLYQGYWFSFRPRDLSESYAAELACPMPTYRTVTCD